MECNGKSHTFASAFEKQARERKKKEFFEKIYINREVVQEASMETYLGKRNEPFNSFANEYRAKLAWAMLSAAKDVSQETNFEKVLLDYNKG